MPMCADSRSRLQESMNPRADTSDTRGKLNREDRMSFGIRPSSMRQTWPSQPAIADIQNMFACALACLRACVRACVRACMRTYVLMLVRV